MKYVSAYVRKRLYPNAAKIKTNEKEIYLRDNCGIDLDGHFANFQEIVGQKDSYFRKKGANQASEDEYFSD